jgi:hypothetical protein
MTLGDVLLVTALVLVLAGPEMWRWYVRRIDR